MPKPTPSFDLALLMDHLPAGVVVHALDTSVLYANPRALHLLRMTWAQASGRQAIAPEWRLLDETGCPLTPEQYPVNRVISSGQPLSEVVIGIRNADDPLPTWLVLNAFIDTSESTAKVVVTFSDISAYHRLPFREIVDKAQDAVVVCTVKPIDLPDGPRIV